MLFQKWALPPTTQQRTIRPKAIVRFILYIGPQTPLIALYLFLTATSSGGWRGPATTADKTLIDQSPSGGQLYNEMQDAKQGRDDASASTRSGVSSDGLNPYGGDSWETRKQAEDQLASSYRDARDRSYEGSGAQLDSDPGA
jgi:hypothetical protein